MAKILFVENDLRIDKLGILYLSAILKKCGHETRLVQAGREHLHAVMSLYKPDFVMYSLMTGEHQWFIETNRKLKTEFEFISVFGGPHPTFFPEQSESDKAVDHIVRGGEVWTPPLGPKILPGITRAQILEVADETGIAVHEESFTLAEAAGADEMFVSSTNLELLPITRLGGARVGSGRPGPVYHALHGAYRERVRQRCGLTELVPL